MSIRWSVRPSYFWISIAPEHFCATVFFDDPPSPPKKETKYFSKVNFLKCISQSVFSQSVFSQSVHPQSVFFQSVFLQNVPDCEFILCESFPYDSFSEKAFVTSHLCNPPWCSSGQEWRIPSFSKEENVNHFQRSHYEGPLCAQALGDQARPGAFKLWTQKHSFPNVCVTGLWGEPPPEEPEYWIPGRHSLHPNTSACRA